MNFDGSIDYFRSFKFQISEEFIVIATDLPIDGEKWFKNQAIEADYNQFLKEEHQNIDWSKSIRRSFSKEEWRHILAILECYITCKGIFATVLKVLKR